MKPLHLALLGALIGMIALPALVAQADIVIIQKEDDSKNAEDDAQDSNVQEETDGKTTRRTTTWTRSVSKKDPLSFSALDTDSSGSVSLEEYRAAHEGQDDSMTVRGFNVIDANNDSELSEDEVNIRGKIPLQSR